MVTVRVSIRVCIDYNLQHQ